MLWTVGYGRQGEAPIIGFRALAAARRSLRAMFFASAAYLAFGLIGALSGGVLGTVRGLAISAWFNAVLWWWQLYQAKRKSATAPIRGRQSAQHHSPRPSHSVRDGIRTRGQRRRKPTVNEANGQLEHTGAPESTIPGTPGAPAPQRVRRPVRPYWVAQPRAFLTPGRGSIRFLTPAPSPQGIAYLRLSCLPSLPSASLFPSRVSGWRRPPSGPTNLIAPPDWSMLSSVPAIPMPSFTPRWTVVVASDRTYYDRMWKARAPRLFCYVSGRRQRTAIRAFGGTDERRPTQH